MLNNFKDFWQNDPLLEEERVSHIICEEEHFSPHPNILAIIVSRDENPIQVQGRRVF